MVIYRLGLPYYKEFDNFQFIKNSACPAVSFTAGQALSSYTVCFPGARVSLRPSGRVMSAVRLAGISNS